MNKLKITTRLAMLVGILSLLLIGIGVLGLSGISRTNEALKSIHEDRMVPVGILSEVQNAMLSARLDIANGRGNPSRGEVISNAASARQNLAEVEEHWKRFMQTRMSDKEADLAQKFTVDYQRLVKTGLQPAVEALQANRQEDVLKHIVNDIRPHYPAARALLKQIIDMQVELAEQEYAAGMARYNTIRLVCIVAIALGVLAAIVLGAMFILGLKRSLKVAMEASAAIEQGDLTYDIKVEGADELAQLLNSMAAAQTGLRTIVEEVRAGASSISTASRQIASGNMDLSSRTEEQASSLEETVASMEEITQTVKLNAQNARQANDLASTASREAVRGGEVVARAVDTMQAINNSSRKVVEIIGIIDSIAFQTNILALNAAVEAARAGEQGRGFAVVASEVRTLAQRSASAAREIKALIDESVGNIEQGGTQVAEAGQTMEDIVVSVKRVTDIMSEIAAASDEQSTGIDQINQALSQMDTVTQQNAALVEEAAAAAQSMQEQAHTLSTQVSVFRTERDLAAPQPVLLPA